MYHPESEYGDFYDYYDIFGKYIEDIVTDDKSVTMTRIIIPIPNCNKHTFYSSKSIHVGFVNKYRSLIKSVSKGSSINNSSIKEVFNVKLYILKRDQLKQLKIECNNITNTTNTNINTNNDLITKSHMITPCNHICLCEICYTNIRECPICRIKLILNLILIYNSNIKR